jgi:hypothetical protein
MRYYLAQRGVPWIILMGTKARIRGHLVTREQGQESGQTYGPLRDHPYNRLRQHVVHICLTYVAESLVPYDAAAGRLAGTPLIVNAETHGPALIQINRDGFG